MLGEELAESFVGRGGAAVVTAVHWRRRSFEEVKIGMRMEALGTSEAASSRSEPARSSEVLEWEDKAMMLFLLCLRVIQSEFLTLVHLLRVFLHIIFQFSFFVSCCFESGRS